MLVKTKTECFLLGKNGLQKEVKRELKRGQIFRLEYPSCENKQVAMIEEIKSDYFQGFKCVDLKKFQLVTVEHPRPESEIFGIGYYYTEGNLVTEEVLQDAISKIAEYDKKREEEANEIIRLSNLERDRVEKEFSYLPAKLSNEYTNISDNYKTAKKNLIFELKKAFPTVKFSVTKHNYDTMNINYTDGVTTEQVKKIANKYEGKGFDGMTDCQYSKTSHFNDFYGSVGYLFIERSFSSQIENDASNQLFGIDYNLLESCQRWDDLRDVRRILCKIDFTSGDYESLIMNLDFNNK